MAGQDEKAYNAERENDTLFDIYEDDVDHVDEPPRGRSVCPRSPGPNTTQTQRASRRPKFSLAFATTSNAAQPLVDRTVVSKVSETRSNMTQVPPTRTMFPRRPRTPPPATRTMFPRRESAPPPPPPERVIFIPQNLRSPQPPKKPIVNIFQDKKFLVEIEALDKEDDKLRPKSAEEALARLNQESERKQKEWLEQQSKKNIHSTSTIQNSFLNIPTRPNQMSDEEEMDAALARKLQEQQDAELAQQFHDEERGIVDSSSCSKLYAEWEINEIIRLAQGLLRSRTTVPFRRLANIFNHRYAIKAAERLPQVAFHGGTRGHFKRNRRAPWRTAADLIQLSKSCSDFKELLKQHGSGDHLGDAENHYSDDEEDQDPSTVIGDIIMEDSDEAMTLKRDSKEEKDKDADSKKPRYRY